jgi:class 3 adenylate cyclase/tetratricopeptide (TPR) repeat protein
MGYPRPGPVGDAIRLKSRSIVSEKEFGTTLQIPADPAQADLISLQRLWHSHDADAWSSDPRNYALLCDRILKLGEPLMAYDVVAEGIKFFPKDVRLRQLLALALARSGAAAGANAILEELYREGHRDEETVGLLGRTYKDLAGEAVDSSEAFRYLQRACSLYTEAYQATRGYWSGINAATLALLLGEREKSLTLAREIREQCRFELNRVKEASRDRYWVLSTLGEAALIAGDWPEAEDCYGKALEEARGDWGSVQSIRHNAGLLMQYLGLSRDLLDGLFRFPSVVVFTGHMIDQPGRKTQRFPPQLEGAVKNELRRRLKNVGTGFGYASAACGSDILFHEIIFDLKAETHVVLPYEKEFFVRDSVVIGGGAWVERFQNVIGRAVEVQEASNQRRKGSSMSYEFCNLMLYGLASMRAQQLETKLVALAVWDGKAGEGPSGTADTVKKWRELGISVEIIDLREVLRGGTVLTTHAATVGHTNSRPINDAALDAEPEFAPEIRALLFADVEGFSALPDEEIPRFVHHFLGLAGKLSSESKHKPLTTNTWGDGLYLVFSNVGDAAQFALELRDAVRVTDWSKKGLPGLGLRIGLHAGPVYSCTDPVTRRPTYVGAHVNRAARIEPITPTGQVYASGAFAALVAAEDVKELHCDYVGRTPLAKKYGTFPTYIVRRRTNDQGWEPRSAK